MLQESITIADLNNLRKEIELKLPNTYVDITKNCLIWAENHYPELFFWDVDNCIIHRRKQWSKDNVEQEFNWRITKDIKETMLDLLKK